MQFNYQTPPRRRLAPAAKNLRTLARVLLGRQQQPCAAMNDSMILRRFRRLFQGRPGTGLFASDAPSPAGAGAGLLLENLEPRVLYSASPVEAPTPFAPGPDAVQAAADPAVLAMDVAPLPAAELATLRNATVTLASSATGEPDHAAVVVHETAHVAEAAMERWWLAPAAAAGTSLPA